MHAAKLFIFLILCLFQSLPLAQARETPQELTISSSDNWPPFSYLDKRGEARGILIDLWREFGKENGVTISFKLVSWEKSLTLIRDGEVNLHAGLFKDKEAATFLDFSDPLQIPLPTRLFISKQLKGLNIRDMGTLVVGVTKEGAAEAFIRKNFPAIALRHFSSNKEIIEAALTGDILAFATDYPSALYFFHILGAGNPFQVVETLFTENFYAAAPKGDKKTLAFINSGMRKMPADALDCISQKWIEAKPPRNIWIIPVIAFLSALLICIVSIYGMRYIRALKNQLTKQTKELQKLSQTDPLTAVYHRQKSEAIFSRERYRCHRYHKPLSIILVDMDNFTELNEQHQHSVGDEILIILAQMLQNHIRLSDTVGRMGGEQFIIICPETNEAMALQLSEKLRQIIEDFHFPVVTSCSASFGVTEVLPEDEDHTVFARVEQALSQSKLQGKNRVTSC